MNVRENAMCEAIDIAVLLSKKEEDDRYFSPDHPVKLWLTELNGSPIGWFTGIVGDVSELVALIAKCRQVDAAFAARPIR